MRRFENKVVLITGAASGIGRASAERIASEGGKLFLLDVDAAGLEETAKRCAELGADVATQICDVSNQSAARASVEAAGSASAASTRSATSPASCTSTTRTSSRSRPGAASCR